MAIASVAPGQTLAATTVNSLIAGVNGTALQGIIPTSVAGTGVSVTAGGSVVGNAATTISVNGVFSGSFDNYRIVWNSSTRSTANSMYVRLRQTGTDIASASYAYTRGADAGTTRTITSATMPSGATGIALDSGIASGQTSDGYIDIFGPANGAQTTSAGTAVVIASGAATSFTITGLCTIAAASDGFSLFLGGGGTLTGTVRVYGYNNLT